MDGSLLGSLGKCNITKIGILLLTSVNYNSKSTFDTSRGLQRFRTMRAKNLGLHILDRHVQLRNGAGYIPHTFILIW